MISHCANPECNYRRRRSHANLDQLDRSRHRGVLGLSRFSVEQDAAEIDSIHQTRDSTGEISQFHQQPCRANKDGPWVRARLLGFQESMTEGAEHG